MGTGFGAEQQLKAERNKFKVQGSRFKAGKPGGVEVGRQFFGFWILDSRCWIKTK